jgi:hypothetical protein
MIKGLGIKEMDSKFLEAICLASVEVLGEKEAFQVLKGMGISSFSTLGDSNFSLERYGQELSKRYDIQTARGLLIRIGRASLIFLRRYYSDISDLGSMDNRLKPIEKRFSYSLEILAQKVGTEMGTQVQTSAQDSFTYRWRLEVLHPLFEPYFHFGLLEEFCNWLDSRWDYQIVYSSDSLADDFTELTLRVKERE